MSEAMLVRKGGSSGGSIDLQEKTVSPSVTRQEVTPDEGYGGLSKVNVEAIPNQKAAATYTPGLTEQKIEAGQWLTGDQTIAAISPTKAAQVYTPTLEVQTIPADRWLTGDQTIAAISPTKGAEIYIPGLTTQTIPAGRWLTGDQTIAAISPTKAAEIYIPGLTTQTIPAGRWLTGDQTISGDGNLVAANIKKGVSIFNVAGSYEAAGLDTNSAVLKVVTSTGCSVRVTNGNDYDVEQLDAEGFVRSGDANVTEHFFVIPTAAFGTFSVTATHPTYGDNTKTNAVVIGNAGKVYEVLCGGKNIILDGTFGLQEGYPLYSDYFSYDNVDKRIIVDLNTSGNFVSLFKGEGNYNFYILPVSAYTEISCTAVARDLSGGMRLLDQGLRELAALSGFSYSSPTTVSEEITGKRYDTAGLYCNNGISYITSIILT